MWRYLQPPTSGDRESRRPKEYLLRATGRCARTNIRWPNVRRIVIRGPTIRPTLRRRGIMTCRVGLSFGCIARWSVVQREGSSSAFDGGIMRLARAYPVCQIPIVRDGPTDAKMCFNVSLLDVGSFSSYCGKEAISAGPPKWWIILGNRPADSSVRLRRCHWPSAS